MAAKDFTPRQVEVLIQGCEMVVASFQRRVNAEKDAETRAVWQKRLMRLMCCCRRCGVRNA